MGTGEYPGLARGTAHFEPPDIYRRGRAGHSNPAHAHRIMASALRSVFERFLAICTWPACRHDVRIRVCRFARRIVSLGVSADSLLGSAGCARPGRRTSLDRTAPTLADISGPHGPSRPPGMLGP